MNNRDAQIINSCIKHYHEMCEEMADIHTYEDFVNHKNKIMVKAIKIDLAKIGENLTHLSKESASQIDENDLKGIVGIRNIIVHGYAVIKDKALYNSIINDMPRLMQQVSNIK